MATNRPHDHQQVEAALTQFLREHSLESDYHNDVRFHTVIELIRRMLHPVALAARMHLCDGCSSDTTVVGMLVSAIDLMLSQATEQVLALIGQPTIAARVLDADPRLIALKRICKSPRCRAAIFWAHTGRAMTPVDYEPVPVQDGTIRLAWPAEANPHMLVFPVADTVSDQTVRETLYPGDWWYRPHWQTCPDASEFRAGRTGKS